MTHDLMHGNLGAAVVDNVFLLVGLPLLVVWVVSRRHQRRRLWPLSAVVTVVIAAVAWTVVRNLPGFPLVPSVLAG
jgi:uncharacterized membrane protein YqjE